jgi:molecular chaperone HscC
MIVGIDLGTTNSAIAFLGEHGPELIPNAVGGNLTPSVVGFEPQGHLLVGAAAREYQVIQPERCATLFKRHMGTDWKFEIDDRCFSAEELSAIILKSLRDDAEHRLGCSVSRAVITVPAYFSDQQRKATIRAGELAGLRVERIVNEPTAAAMAYGLHEAGEEKTIAVFDLGGGTFDISVVDLFEGLIEVRASSGESFLGGEDFTRSLAARVLHGFGIPYERAEVETPLLVSRMVQQCELAKRRLSSEASVEIRLPDKEGDLVDEAASETVTREQFEQWTEPLLARVELPIRRCLGDVRLRPSFIDEVILVGGATRMPSVRRRVDAFFQQPAHHRLNPDEVVVLGAAVQAGLIERNASLEDLVVTDVAPFTLGVEVAKRIGTGQRPGYFSPIIHRNTTIPISRVERFATVEPNQDRICLRIFQGESRRVADNVFLGELEMSELPRGPAGQEVEVRMTYDLNGVLEVEAAVVLTGDRVRTVIARHAHGLSEDDVAAAVEAMQALKLRPRADAAIRYLFRRAERLYRELPFSERDELGQLLDGFEQVLEMQDRQAIEITRQHLEQFLARFKLDEDDSQP